jgi:hypothetical protein
MLLLSQLSKVRAVFLGGADIYLLAKRVAPLEQTLAPLRGARISLRALRRATKWGREDSNL